MTLHLEVAPDAEEAARRVAALIAERARAARRLFALALSRTPPALLAALAAESIPWERVRILQVDERVAPAGHADRNLTALLAGLPPAARFRLAPMPVEESDLEAAAARYAAGLPPLDLVHLGLGADGHTASLLPGDPVLEVRDRLVAVTGEHGGRRRMTLTYPALEAAGELVWLVTGEEKRPALARLLAGDPSIAAARIRHPRRLVVADREAAPSP
ncbi:MAG TPA: 6-phosphogluconolactonase [Gaiellaceae bacterium]|nr:6-phosphogluconolactonase [Gaiellaceae bacterium]